MEGFPPSLERVIDAFSRFPGIGKKTAQRLGLYVLKSDINSMTEFANSLVDVKEKITFCVECNNFAEAEKCEICENPKRDRQVICVVEESNNKFLSVGIAKMSSDKANSTKTGIVVENLHYISDKFWETKKEIKD